MLAIKLRMVGKKKQRSFRIVVQEKKAKLQGKFSEDLGWYSPHSNSFDINNERVLYWINCGAQPTKTVGDILKKQRRLIEKAKTTKKETEKVEK
ncbi:MAG: 30S ribosomal protein S16 [bacterium]